MLRRNCRPFSATCAWATFRKLHQAGWSTNERVPPNKEMQELTRPVQIEASPREITWSLGGGRLSGPQKRSAGSSRFTTALRSTARSTRSTSSSPYTSALRYGSAFRGAAEQAELTKLRAEPVLRAEVRPLYQAPRRRRCSRTERSVHPGCTTARGWLPQPVRKSSSSSARTGSS